IGVSRHIAEADEFILEGAVEPFVDCVVFWCFDPRPVMLKPELLTGGFKVAVELTPIVSLHVLDLPVQEDMQAVEEIAGRCRAGGGVHPGKGNLGVPVDGCEDIALVALPVAYHGIEAEEKSGDWLTLQLGDLLAGMRDA